MFRLTKVLFLFLLGFSFILSCKQNTATTKPTKKIVSTDNSVFSEYFDAGIQSTILKIKAEFEKGIDDGFNFDEIGKAYKYHAVTLRSDMFNELPYTLTFPYDGTFQLANYEEEMLSLPFFTKKCGFEDTKNDRIINYWCLNLLSDFINYLDKVGGNYPLAKQFSEVYKTKKTITPDLKQSLLLHSEGMDYNNFDHQLIYMLLHLSINEERIALDQLK